MFKIVVRQFKIVKLATVSITTVRKLKLEFRKMETG